MKARSYIPVGSLFSFVFFWALFAPALEAGDFDRQVGESVDMTLLSRSDPTIIRFDFDSCARETVMINGREFLSLRLDGESLTFEKGLPELPRVCRSMVIPNGAKMKVDVIDSAWSEIEGDVAPSKGIISRAVDPETVPYTFDAFYGMDAWHPAEPAALGAPYVLRDLRGAVLTMNPFCYNPAKGIIRVCTSMTVKVTTCGVGVENVLPDASPRRPSRAFHQLYKNHFVNFTGGRYPPLDEEGDLLIIVHDAWWANVQPLKTWKDSIGIATTVVNVSTIGNNASSIKSYIQNVYDTSNLAFVLLVGDDNQVASPTANNGASDPSYSLLAGGDNYPDIMVGRFSAETAAHVDTQVERTVEFEQADHSDFWFWKGTGISFEFNPERSGEGNRDQMDHIRKELLAFGYIHVDEIYDPGATAQEVVDALNEGRGIVNYCGHGSTSSWGTTGFSNSHINSLVNDNMLPFITSVACQNGNFRGRTCFAETWLRATHSGEPTGAVGAYMSSVNQAWGPPMKAQKEYIDRYTDGSYDCYGTLCYAGSCKMIDAYGWSGVKEFQNWHVFGDPSLDLRRGGGPPAPPTPDIKVNGSDGPLSVPVGTVLDVTVSLDPGDLAGIDNDWWIFVERNSSTTYWFSLPQSWTQSAVPIRAYGGPLQSLPAHTVANGALSATGQWDFFFCVDSLNNGYDGTREDSVRVQVN